MKSRNPARQTRRSSRRETALASAVEPLEGRTLFATVFLDVWTTTDPTDGQTPGVNTLREKIIQANQVNPADDVVVRLNIINIPHLLNRSTIQNFNSTEGTALDEFYGDFDIKRSMTIQGQGANTIIENTTLARIFEIAGPHNVTIKNMTIRNGNAPSLGGGAVRIAGGANVTFENVRFENNAVNTGGGVRGGAVVIDNNAGGSVTFTGGAFVGNTVNSTANASMQGGAIWHSGGSLTINGSQFTNNAVIQQSSNTGGAHGGAIFTQGGNFNVSNATFDRNSTLAAPGVQGIGNGTIGRPSEGGAIHIAGSDLRLIEIRDSTFTHNIAKARNGGDGITGDGEAGGAARGGALFVSSTNTQTLLGIYDSRFAENLAAGGDSGGTVAAVSHLGGVAEGGAVAVLASSFFGTQDTHFRGNTALAGNGGAGGTGFGGTGGRAAGGALFIGSAVNSVGIFGSTLAPDANDPNAVRADSLFDGNSAVGGFGRPGLTSSGAGGDAIGGAFAVMGGTLDVEKTMFHRNSAQAGHGAHGSAIAAGGGNSGAGRGGAIYTAATTFNISDSALVKNNAVGARLISNAIVQTPRESSDGTTKVTLDDVVAPMNAGAGGQSKPGGRGGDATGGAVHVQSGRLVMQRSGVSANEATGGMGGPGGAAVSSNNPNAPGFNGGMGGAGGDARGAGIHVASLASLKVVDSYLTSNWTLGGRGGSGGRGGDDTAGTGDNGAGGIGGPGGAGGQALGGAISSQSDVSGVPANNLEVVGSYLGDNKVFGGDGGLGAHGGTGQTYGGFGGPGGAGGRAAGGAIFSRAARIDRSTLDRNLVSAGWGGMGGHGSSGGWIAGYGLQGGTGGNAHGGGLAFDAANVQVFNSTITHNRLHSGGGGVGGFGGIGHLGGGYGGNGGNGGAAFGGGIYNAQVTGSGVAGTLTVERSTVAGNRITAGPGGVAGGRGEQTHLWSYSSTPYRVQTKPQPIVPIPGTSLFGPASPITDGAMSVLNAETIYAPGLPGNTTIADPIGGSSNSYTYLNQNTQNALYGAAAGAAAVPLAIGAAGGALAGLVTIGAGLNTVFAAGGATTVATVGVGTAGFVFGGFLAGGAVLAIGAAVGVKFVGALVAGADPEDAARFALGNPGEVSRNNISVLIQGAGPQPPEPPGPQPAFNGNGGSTPTPQGAGIYGGLTLRRSLVAHNTAASVARPTTEKTVNVSGTSYRVIEYDQVTTNLNRADFEGTGVSQGSNLVSKVSGGLAPAVLDQFGTTGSPIDARIDSQVRDHGGGVPTLKLLPASPARDAISIPQFTPAETSQNGYVWQWPDFYDIGAWGAGVNNAPVANNDEIVVAQTGLVVPFTWDALLANDTDPDDDPLSVVVVTHNPTYVTLNPDGSGFTAFVPNGTAPGTVFNSVITYRASDGQFVSGVRSVNLRYADLRPVVDQSEFLFETAHRFALSFSQNVQPSLDASDLVVTPAGGGTPVSPTSVTWDASSKTATWTLASALPDGNYVATLPANSVNYLGFNMPGDHTLPFFVLAGDANRDRSVNIADFSILAARLNQPGTFSQGDFNYDGIANIADFAILAGKFNSSLPAPGSLARPATNNTATRPSGNAAELPAGRFGENRIIESLAI